MVYINIKTFVIFLAELLNSQSNELSKIANVCTVSLLIFAKHALHISQKNIQESQCHELKFCLFLKGVHHTRLNSL